MNPPQTKPIDLLILDTLAVGKLVTANEIAATWGEDRTRIYEWLEKFRKCGLCHHRVIPGRKGELGKLAYLGLPKPIAEYLASNARRSYLKKHG